MEQTKTCSIKKGCGQTKSIDEFYKNRTEKGTIYHKYTCKDCDKKRDRKRLHNKPEIELLKESKKRAKQKNIQHDITLEDIHIPDICPILGIKLEKNCGGKTASYNSPSLDRRDPNGGYTKDNISVISFRANTLKSNATIEELKKVIDALERMNANKS